MAAVTRSTETARPAMPPGYEIVAAGITLAGADLEAGDICYLDGSNGWKLATATLGRTKQCAFAAQDYAAGRNDCSMLIEGELDNYAEGMTPGDALFLGSVAGDLDTAAATVSITETVDSDGGVIALPDRPRIWAATATRIRFRL